VSAKDGKCGRGGKLPPERRDTRRRFEQWAHNPACEANTLSAVHGISMAEVAKREGLTPSMGQSPFAVARGQTFERGLFRDGAAELRAELERVGVLPNGSTGLLDLRMKQIGGPMLDLDAARDATRDLLRAFGRADPNRRPSIIASATLLIPSGVMLPEALLVVDVIAATYTARDVVLTVGEIKTYPDRGGHTDTGELATARAQAGVYVHALRMVAEELGVQDHVRVSERGFLVLSRPGFNRPSVRANEDLKYQAWRAQRGFGQLEAAAARLPAVETADGVNAPARLDAVRSAATAYHETCVSFCDRAPACFAAAIKGGSAAVLGEDVERFLGTVSLERATALMDGARPGNEAEADLQRRLAEQP
jgi:hypothetical protein